MADDVENDDQWLYGDAPDLAAAEGEKPAEELPEPIEEEPQTEALVPEGNIENENEPENQDQEQPAPPESEPPPQTEEEEEEGQLPPPEVEDNDQPPGMEEGEHTEQDQQNGDGSDKEDSDDDSDDDVNVVIGDIKTSPAYTSLNIKRGGLLTSTVTDKSKQQQQTGKFTVEEFDQMGMINGVSAAEYNLDNLEDKPWRKPGADITDYFNYGFNEDTWKAYCERQKRLRVNESGVGLVPLNSIGLPRGPVPIMNDNSKYSGSFTGIRKAGPPPGRRMTGAIDVIGGAAALGSKMDAPKENVIQVMTADRREYSRKPPGFPDLSMPPPTTFDEFQPEFGFNPEPEPFYGGYEPTQDLQWGPGGSRNWAPNQIKSLTPGPGMVPAPVPPVTLGPPMVPPVISSPPHSRRGSRDRERESRSRSEKPRDRDRERSHRRERSERSRSRSRRHKSRSRSPSHRHRKKKSRRHEDSD